MFLACNLGRLGIVAFCLQVAQAVEMRSDCLARDRVVPAFLVTLRTYFKLPDWYLSSTVLESGDMALRGLVIVE